MYLLFDIGGTHTRLGLSENCIDFIKTEVTYTPKFFEDALKLIQEFTNKYKIDKISGGLAGVLDQDKRLLLKSNFPEWNYQPVADSLEELFQAEVFLENDAALGALGEATYGAGSETKILAYITLGTGVGGARVVNGRIDPTTYGFEIGHQIISSSGPLCPFCQGHGHLISYTSGTSIFETNHKHSEDITNPEIWDEVTKKLAVGLNNVCVFWSPEKIVLGGSVMEKINLDKLREYLEQNLKIFPEIPKLLKAKLENPGLYGALEYLKQNS